jgi:hypothetical protein
MPTATSLKQFLSAPNNFTELNLSNQSINNNDCIELSKVLKVNTTIRNIHLAYNQIEDEGIIALANGLKINSTVLGLQLNNNHIGDKGVTALGQMLNGHKSLYWIDISHNQVGDIGLLALASGLETNSILSQLNLSYNQIGDIGVSAFGNKFPLHELHLNNNLIGDNGAKSLAKTLINHNIGDNYFKLELNNNVIKGTGAISLVEALKGKKCFDFKLNLENNPIDFDTTNYFETIQEKNIRIDFTKGQYSTLEMSQKDSLLKVEEDPRLNLNDFNQIIQSEQPLKELEKALAHIKELEDQNNKKDIRIKELEERNDQMSYIINDLREDKTELRSEKNEWKTKYETKDNLLQKMVEELTIERAKVIDLAQKIAVYNHEGDGSWSQINQEVSIIGEGLFEIQSSEIQKFD